MTPKEKAEKLFYDYLTFFPEFYNDKEYDYDTDKAKQCALIAVDEVLSVPYLLKSEKYFYTQVKQEIEKL